MFGGMKMARMYELENLPLSAMLDAKMPISRGLKIEPIEIGTSEVVAPSILLESP